MSREDHRAFAQEAAARYLAERNAEADAADWNFARSEARRLIIGLLRASNFLTDLAPALEVSGHHMTVLRHLLAPPLSQDQFALIANGWAKSTEKDSKPVRPSSVAQIAAVFLERRDRRLTPWLTYRRAPRMDELQFLMGAVAPLVANQRLATSRRNRLALRQERDAMDALIGQGWSQRAGGLITTGGALEARQFMHKARFQSGKKENQEIDIACGLGDTYILAVECKVTNDQTNSIKRINDILKKANAWRAHWGAFVIPAAMLEGNIKYADVERLLAADVQVFWSHRLDLFIQWVESRIGLHDSKHPIRKAKPTGEAFAPPTALAQAQRLYPNVTDKLTE